MNTEELGNIIEKWQNANWNYVTKEQCENFRNEYEKETENEDNKAIIENIKLKVTGNFTMLPGKNRFLLPREWGVEPFYTFIPRERLEGSATSRSIALKTEYTLFPNWNLSLLSAWVHMPDVFDFESNKYQVPSYFHLNFASRYKFKGWMDGLSLFVMYVYKGRLGETYDNGKFIINKINLSNYNAVIDYSF